VSLVVTGAAASLGRLVVGHLLECGVPAGEIAATDGRAPATGLSEALPQRFAIHNNTEGREPSRVES
jgi:hypothetical protein